MKFLSFIQECNAKNSGGLGRSVIHKAPENEAASPQMKNKH